MPRKPRVEVTVERVISFVANHGIVSESAVAECLDISPATARRKLEGAVYRGVLLQDEYDSEGHRLPKTEWRYCVAS